MIKLRTFLFSFFLLQMGISHADSLEVEVKREGGDISIYPRGKTKVLDIVIFILVH
ncbi:Uncharacterised protein [Yersinia enterocolitica]|nr:Uncharacterised protein [Yersinia enterocolitica]CRY38059.1 Uncharacterised protein [Yersinia enterocolitica]